MPSWVRRFVVIARPAHADIRTRAWQIHAAIPHLAPRLTLIVWLHALFMAPDSSTYLSLLPTIPHNAKIIILEVVAVTLFSDMLVGRLKTALGGRPQARKGS
jgi:hypothetical protein